MKAARQSVVAAEASWRPWALIFRGPAEASLEAGALAAAFEGTLGLPEGSARRHAWAPMGLSLVWLGAGHRVVLHTWPERGEVAVDVALEGGAPSLDALVRRLGMQLGWSIVESSRVTRGDGQLSGSLSGWQSGQTP